MRKTLTRISIAAIVLLPTACATTAEPVTATPEPVVTTTTAAPIPTTTSAEPTTAAPTIVEPTETETAPPAEPASPSPTATAVPTETTASAEPTSSDDTLGFGGLDGLSIGDTDLIDSGAVVMEPECQIYISNPDYIARGVYLSLNNLANDDPTPPLTEILIRTPESGEPIATDAGITPGMTFGDVRAAYPDATEEQKIGNGGPFTAVVARDGDLEMVFMNDEYMDAPIDDGQTVSSIALREYSEEMRGSC